MLGPKKITGRKKIIGKKNLRVKIFFIKILGLRKILVPHKFLVKKNMAKLS